MDARDHEMRLEFERTLSTMQRFTDDDRKRAQLLRKQMEETAVIMDKVCFKFCAKSNSL